MDIITVHWTEHPTLQNIEIWIDENITTSGNILRNGNDLSEVKHNANEWVDNQIFLLEQLKERIKTIPDTDEMDLEVNEDDYNETS